MSEYAQTKYYSNPEFRSGYNSAALDLELDETKSISWQKGWFEYHLEFDRSENARYI